MSRSGVRVPPPALHVKFVLSSGTNVCYGRYKGDWIKLGRWPSGQRRQTVNLVSYEFEGSNPSLPTNSFIAERQSFLLDRVCNSGRRRRTSCGLCFVYAVFAGKQFAGVAQMVEHQPSKLRVAGSNPVSRSEECRAMCAG